MQDDTVAINAEMVSATTKNSGDHDHQNNIFPEGITSVWECLEGDDHDVLLNDNQRASETLSLHL